MGDRCGAGKGGAGAVGRGSSKGAAGRQSPADKGTGTTGARLDRCGGRRGVYSEGFSGQGFFERAGRPSTSIGRPHDLGGRERLGGAPRSRGSRAGGIRAEDRDSIPSRGILDRAAWGPVCRARYGRESTQRVRWSPRPSGQPVRRADGQWGPVLEALAIWHPQGNTRAGCAARIEVAWRTNSTPHHLIPGSLPLALTRRPPGGESKCSRGCPNPARRSLKRENPYWPAQSTRGFFAAHAGAGLGRTATTAKKTMRALRRTEAGHLSSLQARLRHGGID